MTADPKPNTARRSRAAKAAVKLVVPPTTIAAAIDATDAGPTDADTAVLFAAGRTIAQIARQVKVSHEDVRALLDAAGVDYSKDKNATANRAPAAAAPSATRSLLPHQRLRAFMEKAATGDLSAKKRNLADRLKGEGALADILTEIAKMQATDEEAFGRALGALAAFLWSVEGSK